MCIWILNIYSNFNISNFGCQFQAFISTFVLLGTSTCFYIKSSYNSSNFWQVTSILWVVHCLQLIWEYTLSVQENMILSGNLSNFCALSSICRCLCTGWIETKTNVTSEIEWENSMCIELKTKNIVLIIKGHEHWTTYLSSYSKTLYRYIYNTLNQLNNKAEVL